MKAKSTPCLELLVKVAPFITPESREGLLLATLKLERIYNEVNGKK